MYRQVTITAPGAPYPDVSFPFLPWRGFREDALGPRWADIELINVQNKLIQSPISHPIALFSLQTFLSIPLLLRSFFS